jgi:hypothetical protein
MCLVLVGPYLSAAEHEKPVRIPDCGLEQAIRNELSKTDGDITRHDLASLRVLDGGGKNLFSTEGLEHAINLVSLDLRFNQLTNLHLPQGTLALTNLDLGSNLLKEAAFLNRMPELQYLSLWGNRIDQIELSADFSDLRVVNLSGNRITQLNVPESMHQLRELNLQNNQLKSFALPVGFTNLTVLNLRNNRISKGFFPVGLVSLKKLELSGNYLSELFLPDDMRALEQRFLSLDKATNAEFKLLNAPDNLEWLSLFGNGLRQLVLPSKHASVEGFEFEIESIGGS